jgi:hypothetical protein
MIHGHLHWLAAFTAGLPAGSRLEDARLRDP